MRDKEFSPFFLLSAAIFITCLLVSNIIAVKLIKIFGLILPAAIVVFPITYIFGDILTEVYGYGRARLVIWLGFFCNLIMVGFIKLGEILPAVSFWSYQEAYSQILGFTPRLLLASFTGYLVGEFLNSFVLSKMKILTRGRLLWTRTIGSTVLGQLGDSSVFITIAFIHTVPGVVLLKIIITQWLFKIIYESLATPVTYLIVRALKRVERVDTFDYQVNYNPLKFTLH